MANSGIEVAKLIVSFFGLGGTLVAAIIAVRTFRRTEKWKRAEFLAREMKEFFDNPRVRTALTLIDWSSRNVPLLDQSAPEFVTREDQCRALVPHVLPNEPVVSDIERSSKDIGSSKVPFSIKEAAIRDCFDAFLDGLERFSNYVQTGLVDISALRPYLGYWIDDIYSYTPDMDEADAEWSAILLTYIQFYNYSGVQWLFEAFNQSIDPSKARYKEFLTRMRDKGLAGKLEEAAKIRYPPSDSSQGEDDE